MRTYIIRLTSITYAIRAERLLRERGIRARIKKLSQSLGVRGCGYGLSVAGPIDASLQILASAGIRVVETLEDTI